MPSDISSPEKPDILPELDGIKIDEAQEEEFENLKYAKVFAKQGTNESNSKYKDRKLDAEIKMLDEIDVNSDIKDAEEMAVLKILMEMKIGIPFCTNVLRVALNFKETKIAR
jgi:hypothetical protein